MLVALAGPTEALAQRHGGRPAHVVGAGFYGGFYYRPFFFDPWFGAAYPIWWYPPYAYAGVPDLFGSLRLQVEPKTAEVFIDGHFAGTVDDFDGFFQRLRVEPGEHELELYSPGHRSVRQQIYLQPGVTFRVKHALTPLGPGEAPLPRPTPEPQAAVPATPIAPPAPPSTALAVQPGAAATYGTVAIRVQPDGAEILVDGERWDGPAGAARLVIQLPEGDHQVEIRREGFSPYTATVRITRSATTTLNVSLVKE
jgi:hypothetical protein